MFWKQCVSALRRELGNKLSWRELCLVTLHVKPSGVNMKGLPRATTKWLDRDE